MYEMVNGNRNRHHPSYDTILQLKYAEIGNAQLNYLSRSLIKDRLEHAISAHQLPHPLIL